VHHLLMARSDSMTRRNFGLSLGATAALPRLVALGGSTNSPN
jgi:hypothetical protein